MATAENPQDVAADAFRAGRRVGFGVSALTLALVSFLSLLGAEKAILAIVLGTLAIRGSRRGTRGRRLGMAAIAIGSVFILVLAVGLILFWDDVQEFILTLHKLS